MYTSFTSREKRLSLLKAINLTDNCSNKMFIWLQTRRCLLHTLISVIWNCSSHLLNGVINPPPSGKVCDELANRAETLPAEEQDISSYKQTAKWKLIFARKGRITTLFQFRWMFLLTCLSVGVGRNNMSVLRSFTALLPQMATTCRLLLLLCTHFYY